MQRQGRSASTRVLRHARAARHRRRRRGLLRGARRACTSCTRARRRVRRLHRAAEGERLPVAAHRRCIGRRRARRSRCRSAPARCTSTPSTASPRTGPTRRPARAASRRQRRRRFEASIAEARKACCASCSPGSATRRVAATRGEWRRSVRASAVRRPHLRLHAAGGGRRAARRRDADRLRLRACTPISAIAAAARKVDGAMVPLNTPLRSGQTVEIVAAKEGGPSLRLAQSRARLPAEPRARRPRCGLVQGAGARARPSRAAARRSRSCCSARAGRRSSSRRSPRRLGFAQADDAVRGRRQGRDLAAQHRGAAARRRRRRRRRAGRRRDRGRQRAEPAATAGGGVLVVGVDRC